MSSVVRVDFQITQPSVPE